MSEKMSKKDEKVKKEERIDIMSPAKILQDEKIYARELQNYFRNLEKQSRESKEQAKAQAKEALKQTGVITSNGSAKKKIVSWE